MKKNTNSPERKTLMGFPLYYIDNEYVMSDNDASVFFAVSISSVCEIAAYNRAVLNDRYVFARTPENLKTWMDQFVSIPGQKVIHRPDFFFTEFGVFMLSIFLKSEIAKQFSRNIAEVLFAPRQEHVSIELSQVLAEMDKNETLKVLWASYRSEYMMEPLRGFPGN